MKWHYLECPSGSQDPCVFLSAMVGEKASMGGKHCEGRIIFTSHAHIHHGVLAWMPSWGHWPKQGASAVL